MKIKNLDAAVGIIYNSVNEILIQKKDMKYFWFPGKWCLFGGGLNNEDDSPKEALIRELNEEGIIKTSIDEKPFLIKPYHDKIDEYRRQGQQYIYLVKFEGHISDINLKEGAGFGFFAKNEIQKIPIVKHDYAILLEFFKKFRK